MKRDLLDELLRARTDRRAVAMLTDLESGEQRLVAREAVQGEALAKELEEAFRFDRSGIVRAADGKELFVNVYNPPLKLYVIGAVHLAQALIPMAKAASYDVTVIDPRGAFATEARFPDVELYAEWPDEVLADKTLDERTAMVALTHDPKIDDPALVAALGGRCFYIGALGSKKTNATRHERLKSKGVTDNALARIHGPIGLSIGARGPAEIAVSIMAEMTQVLRLGSAARS